MATLLLKNIGTLVTMDAHRREIKDGAVLIRGNVIEEVGTSAELAGRSADREISMPNHVVTPGLINTHHHMFQNLTRCIAQDHELFGWLTTLYQIWKRLTPEMVYVSAQVAMAELMLSGCTTSSDHLYLYVNGIQIDHEIEAAADIGMRFNPTRGSMSMGESKGGLPPDILTEDEAHILKETQRAVELFHDNQRHSMLRVGIAPTAPFNVSIDLMREAAAMARSTPGVRLHTHLAENVKDIGFSLEKFNMRPGEYAESVGWLGDDVWHAHCVQLDHSEIELFSRTGTGIAHCPCSNMRLASGIAPIRRMLDKKVKIGLGVDGSASNDSGHLLLEARQAMLLQRVAHSDPSAMSARQALEMATLGGAAVLGRDDIGAIAAGMSADLAGFRTDTLAMSGTHDDPVSALLFGAAHQADLSVINGRVVIEDGQLLPIDLGKVLEQHGRLSRALVNG